MNQPTPARRSPHIKGDDSPVGTPQSANSLAANAGTPPDSTPALVEASDAISSPFKRHRSSVPGLNGFVPPDITSISGNQVKQVPFEKAAEPVESIFTPGPPLPSTSLKTEQQDEEL